MRVRQEVKIGAIAIIAFVLGYLGLNFLKGINIFEPENKYRVQLENLGGTSVATPVMISGYKVGSVQKVDFGYVSGRGYTAELLLGLNPEIKLPKGSQVRIKTNVLSGSVLEIMVPTEAKQGYLTSGDIIPFSQGDDIMSTVSNKIMPQVVEIMPQVVEIMPQIVDIVKRLGEIADNSSIDSVMLNLNRSTMELNRAMQAVNTSLKPLPHVMSNVQIMTGNLAQTSSAIKALPLDSLINNLNATAENMRSMSAQLKSQEGTAGKLLNDPSLYNRLDSLANSADALMKDLKANPKRYVHFSLF